MTRALPWLLLVGVAWFGGCQYQKNRDLAAQQEALTERVKARETVIAALATQKAKVDTVFNKASVRSHTKATAYQRLRDSLSAIGHIPPRSPIADIVRTADTAIAACTDALRVCGQAIAYRDSMIAQQDSMIWAKDSLLLIERKRRRPDWRSKLVWLLAGAAVGVIVK